MMIQLIDRFPDQLTEAIEIGSASSIKPHDKPLSHVYVAGLGGSGIGANFVAEFIADECKIPYTVGKSYSIPKYVGENTLAIISSYSGNTEETLEAFDKIKTTGAKIVIVSSGGKLIAAAKEMGLDYIQVPGDWPSPRACLGFSLVQQLFILKKLKLIDHTKIEEVRNSIDLIKFNNDSIKETAKKLATALHNTIPIIYTTDRMESVAVRFRQQINENAKRLCWHHVIPEMNHNELVGWRSENQDFAVVYFRNKDDYKRNQTRIEINKTIIKKYTNNIIELWSRGNTLIEKAIFFVNLGDYASYYLSQMNKVDSIEVDVIDFLKSELGKV